MQFDDNELEIIMWSLRVAYRDEGCAPVANRIRELSQRIAPLIDDDPIELDPDVENDCVD